MHHEGETKNPNPHFSSPVMASYAKLAGSMNVDTENQKAYALPYLPRPPTIVFVYITLAATANLLFGYENRLAYVRTSCNNENSARTLFYSVVAV